MPILGRLKTRDRKTRDHQKCSLQGVENAGLENAGPSYGGGKRETSCYETPKQQKDKAFIAQ